MSMKYFVDGSGNYLGAFVGYEPEGGIEVDTPPVKASQTWNGAEWSEPVLSDHELKLIGVEIEGVMCSATSTDMYGLKCIEEWVAAGQTVNFEFDNGNTLPLTQSNMDDFKAIWIPFRASFF